MEIYRNILTIDILEPHIKLGLKMISESQTKDYSASSYSETLRLIRTNDSMTRVIYFEHENGDPRMSSFCHPNLPVSPWKYIFKTWVEHSGTVINQLLLFVVPRQGLVTYGKGCQEDQGQLTSPCCGLTTVRSNPDSDACTQANSCRKKTACLIRIHLNTCLSEHGDSKYIICLSLSLSLPIYTYYI